MNKMKKSLVILLTVCLSAGSAYAYGPHGHSLVGAIADRRLAKNPSAAAKVSKLLDGLTLERAATLPDEIKSWDSKEKCHNSRFDNSPVTDRSRVEGELRAFLKANLCNGHPSHHEFHYTDVPVFADERYADGAVGREDFDVVKMIPFCVRVLRGEEPQPNPRGITKTVAVILLAHYFGDIHQPLHVGAEYFDGGGRPFKPNGPGDGFADQGGNKLTLFTFFDGKLTSAGKFHSYWDGQTVDNAFGKSTKNSTVANKLAKLEPANWRLTGAPETWAEKLADEILPLAREAHTRLDFSEVRSKAGDGEIISGRAQERKQSGGKFYAIWAADTVKDEIHKAGWRLAALLEETVR
jgi:hypothetical protein